MKTKNIIITLLLSFIIAIGLSSCASKDPKLPQSSFTATVTVASNSYKVIHNGKTITTITCLQPQQLKGFTYNYCGNQLTLKYNSLSYTPSSASLPISKYVTSLHSTLQDISNTSAITLTDTSTDTSVYSTRTADITTETDTGKITKITNKATGDAYIFSYEWLSKKYVENRHFYWWNL